MDDGVEMQFANPDFDREVRWGLPEVVLGIGKTDEQIVEIVERLKDRNAGPVLVTKTTKDAYDAVLRVAPEAEFFEGAKLIRLPRPPVVSAGIVGVLAAGTADLPVAEEAALTAEAAGASVDRIYDVGVAGLHRLVDRLDRIN
jgi:NCAIR mutase (PurE)-related protein